VSKRPDCVVVSFGKPEFLVDLRGNAHDLVRQCPIGVLHHFGNEDVGDGIAIGVERYLSSWCIERELGKRGLETDFFVRQITLHGLDTLQQGFGVDVVTMCKQ
jgi:hypothetical protein